MGEKIGIFVYLIMSFVLSVIIAFCYGWKLTLVVLSGAPVIVMATAVVAKVKNMQYFYFAIYYCQFTRFITR